MTAAGKNIFLSYTRTDQDRVQPLIVGLRRMSHEIWLDQELSGGQEWWDTILGHIRECDAMMLAVSEKALESEACQKEFAYAKALNKPILPVMVDHVLPTLLWPDLFVLHILDYTGPTDRAAFDLMAALDKLAPAGTPRPPLPALLPEPPPVPISYLTGLSRIVHAPILTIDEQLSVVGKLKAELGRPQDRKLVIQLLHRLRDRNDLYHTPAVEIDEVLATIGRGEQLEPEEPHAPPGEVLQPDVGARRVPAPKPVSVGTVSLDGFWRWDGVRWVPAQASVQSRLRRTIAAMSRWEIATVVLLALPLITLIGLVTVWFTRWYMRTKIIAAGVGVIYLAVVIAIVIVLNRPAPV
jgi:hypothetical protein